MKSALSQEDILGRVLQYMESRNLGSYSSYGGCYEIQDYDQNMKRLVVIADWNDIDNKFADYLENKCDVETGFDDEYSLCECGKAVLTQAQYHGETPNYMIGDGYLLCRECAEDEPGTIIDEYVNNSDNAIRNWMLPIIEKEGFICFENEDSCNRYETGWHPGQNDDPKAIEAWLLENLPDHEYIFAINSSGQFDVQWSVYIRKTEDN